MRSSTSTPRCGLQLDEQNFGEVQISDKCEFVASASFGLRGLSSKRCLRPENGEDFCVFYTIYAGFVIFMGRQVGAS